MINDENKEVEILDEEIDLGIYETARTSNDAFENWKQEEYNEDHHSGEGIYLGDGIYA
jgi:hypothetical protein